ncbi:MAG: hypothetical protein WC236_12810 [Gallionellaceae bacterium]|jgi:hypothetical protein
MTCLSYNAQKILGLTFDIPVALIHHKPRQFSGLCIKSFCCPTTHPPAFRSDQAICKIRIAVFLPIQCFLDGSFILKLHIVRFEQAGKGYDDFVFWHCVAAAQYSFGFHQHELVDQNAAACGDSAFDQFARFIKLLKVVLYQKVYQ